MPLIGSALGNPIGSPDLPPVPKEDELSQPQVCHLSQTLCTWIYSTRIILCPRSRDPLVPNTQGVTWSRPLSMLCRCQRDWILSKSDCGCDIHVVATKR